MTKVEYDEAVSLVRDEWGNEVIDAANRETKRAMTFSEFLNECVCCGGNWGGMILSGVRKLYPRTWDAIPNDMGAFAFTTICNLLIVLDVDTSR